MSRSNSGSVLMESLNINPRLGGMSGYMQKQGGSRGGVKNWKKRFFVLSGSTLRYYTNEKKSKCKGVMNVMGATIHDASSRTERPLCIAIRTVERELLVVPFSHAEQQAWTAAISQAADETPFSTDLPALSNRIESSIRSSVMTLGSVQDDVDGPIHEQKQGCLLRIPGVQSMFWDTQQEKAVFMPSMWQMTHVRSSRFPDFLDLANHSTVLSLMKSHNETRIVFSDFVNKFNRRNRMQRRILLVTDKAVYTLHDTTFAPRRRVTLQEVGGTSSSALGDEFVVLHVPMHYDYLFTITRKETFILQLGQAYEATIGRSMPTRVYSEGDGWQWMDGVWNASQRFGRRDSSIISGRSSKLHKVRSTLRTPSLFQKVNLQLPPRPELTSETIVGMLNSPSHPLGMIVADFLNSFVSQNTYSSAAVESLPQPESPTSKKMLASSSLPEVVGQLKNFFDRFSSQLPSHLSTMGVSASQDSIDCSLHSAVFPAVMGAIKPMFIDMNAENDASLQHARAAMKEDPLRALKFLGLSDDLMQAVSHCSRDGFPTLEDYSTTPDRESLPFGPAMTIMDGLGEDEVPHRKAILIEACCRCIFDCMKAYSESSTGGADDLLPCLIYVTACSQLEHPFTEAGLVAEFVNPDMVGGECFYCCRSFEIGLAALQMMDSSAVRKGMSDQQNEGQGADTDAAAEGHDDGNSSGSEGMLVVGDADTTPSSSATSEFKEQDSAGSGDQSLAAGIADNCASASSSDSEVD